MKFYKVGGAVRDAFLGVKSKDIDFAVEAESFDAMLAEIERRGTVYLSKPEYQTVRARVDGVDADFVLCRKDGTYSDGRRPDFVLPGTILDDLARRDFTMNAIAIDIDTNKVLDPYRGIDDIFECQIRCVGRAEDRFTEDALRMLRAIRFAVTKNFDIEQDARLTMREPFVVNLLNSVSTERIREETTRALMHDTLRAVHQFNRFPEIRDHVFSRVKLKATLEQ